MDLGGWPHIFVRHERPAVLTRINANPQRRNFQSFGCWRRALFSRSGPVVLQDAIVAATRGAGRELAVDARADGRRQLLHRGWPPTADGRGFRLGPRRLMQRSKNSFPGLVRPLRWKFIVGVCSKHNI
jgi:hypothetical protein